MPTSRTNKPRILITMGDPAGIGPEVILKTLASRTIARLADFFVIGDRGVLERAAHDMRLPPLGRTGVTVIDCANVRAGTFAYGRTDGAYGRAAVEYLDRAIAFLKSGAAEAVVTAPINKAAIVKSGFRSFQGHTEYFAEKTGTRDYAMLFVGKRFKIGLVTRHIPFREVPAHLSPERIARVILLTHRALTTVFAVKRPRIAVAGLNPHAGEGGIFGDEERRIITPGIRRAAARGASAVGPFPPDVIFNQALAGRCDAVIALYHDQGLIPFKLLYFKDGVNMTIGLPFIRTSPDHGTAFDIAGTGAADPSSMIAAIRLAAGLAARRR